jgi:NAD(P)-dependent dehydrogenase (short-subunit alcohol dehydrogenase family)
MYRNTKKPVITDLIAKIGNAKCKAFNCQATEDASVKELFEQVTEAFGRFPDVVIYNASGQGGKGPFAELDTSQARKGLLVTAFGGFLVGHYAAKGMVTRGSGSILFTGASASYKGYAKSAPFAMGKFGLHGMAQVGRLQVRQLTQIYTITDCYLTLSARCTSAGDGP